MRQPQAEAPTRAAATPHGSHHPQAAARISQEGETVASLVRRTQRPARIEDFEKADDATADAARAVGVSAAVGAPIVVDGRLGGAIVVSWHGGKPPPADTDDRMAQFAELLDMGMATA
jgi:hypothetical protein